MRYFDRESLDFPRYVGTCMAILAASASAMLVLVLLTSFYLERFTEIPALWLLIAVLSSAFAFIAQIQLVIWQSAKKPLYFAGLRVGQATLDIGVSRLFVVTLGLSWQGRTGGMALAAAVCGIAALFLLWRGGWMRLSFDRDYARSALKFGLPLVPHVIGGFLITTIDRFMITNILDVASTGIYMVAVQIGLAGLLVTDAVNRAVSPWLIEALQVNDAARDKLIVRLSYAYFILLLAGGYLGGLLAPPVFAVLVGEQFRAAGPVLVYITLGQAVGGIYLILSNYIFYAGRTGTLALITLSSGLLNVLMSYWLLTTRGIEGAAQSFLLAQIVLCLGAWWLANKVRPMPWRPW
jgi:O-antigen/teichoic acid export membrane protein